MMEEEKMKNEQFLEQYLSGKAPLHADRLKLPAEEELDVAEAEFDRIVAARKRPARLISFWPWVGTAVAAGVLLLIVLNIGQHQPKQQPIVAETVEQSIPQPATQPIVEEKEEEALPEVQPTPQPAKKRRKAVKKQSTPIEKPLLAEAETIPEESESEQEYLPKEPDPYLLTAAETQDIRSRGEHLFYEVAQMINNH